MSKKQLLSSQTVLLRGAGRTNIEYSAGPNINITDDVISGRDWSQEMAQIVKGGVSAALSGGDNIQITNDQGINIISVTGDLYSAGPNIDITDRTISGKDWTDDIDSHIASAISGKADSSAIPEIVEYSAGDNINITDHVVSGKDWTYEIGQKVGRDEFVSGMSAVTEHMTEVVSATSGEIIDIISATSGQGGGTCPWISGGKDYGSATEQLQFGSVLPIFSSWGLCADHNHYIWMKGAYIRLPDIDPYLSSYLPLCAFSSYTASMASNMSSNWNYTNSAYSMSLSNYYNKLDISAWSAFTADADVTPYSAGNGIDITDHVISFTGSEGQTYSAGDNIDITNNVISGKSWTDEIIAAVSGKQDTLTFNYDGDNNISAINGSAIGGQGGAEYSAGDNINITNNVISSKSWQNEINAATSGKMDKSMSGQFVRGNNTSGFEISSKADGVSAKVSAGYDRMYISAHGSNYNNNIQIRPDSIYLQYSGANGNKTSIINIDSISSWDAKANPADVSGLLNLESPSGTIEINANKIDANTSAVRITNTLTEIFTGVATAGAQSGVDARNATRIFYRCNGSGNHGISCGGGESYYQILPNTTGWYTGHIGATGASSLQFWGMEITGYSGVYSGEKVELAQVDRFEHDGDGKISAYNGSAFAGEDITTKPLSAGEYISITEDAEKVTIGLSGDVGTKYSAGDNININNYVVSGKDWTNEINSAVSSRLPTSSFTAYSAAHSGDDVTPYSGLDGIKVENHVITITGNVGKVYTGVAPIRVDNTSDEISIDHPWNLSAGNNITISADSALNTLTINSTLDDVTCPLCAGPGVGIYTSGDDVFVSAQGGGNKITYSYSTPATSYSAQGDMTINYQTSQSTPARTTIFVADSAVGLLVPNTVNHNSFLMQDQRGSTTWVDASAVVPSSMSAQASYFSKTYTTADSGDTSINDYPEMNRDWTFNIINWKDSPIYYSAAQGTATLEPGYGVRVHYDLDSDWLDAEPEYYVGGIGMKYATCDMLDNRNIEYVATSAQATQSGVLYIITG